MLTLIAEEGAPAGGAAFGEVLIAMAIAVGVYIPLGWFLLRERAGHRTLLGRLADKVSSVDGLPRWAGLPIYLGIASLLLAGFGVYWDVPIHMQFGRDEGPLANPSHYPIFLGILGFLGAGVVGAGLARDPLPRRTVRVARDWEVPMSHMILLGAGMIAAVGFPADDLWHRLFGQDVTEWGPTHVMMIGGAVTAALALPLMLAEARQIGTFIRLGPVTDLFGWLAVHGLRLAGRVLPPVRRECPPETLTDRRHWGDRVVMTIGVGFCVIPMAFLMEFDLGVPQFPAATLFIIGGFLTAWIFTTARLTFGPGGALVGWIVYFVIRVVILLITLPLPTIEHARWSLFLGAAVAIELVALAVRSRGAVFGAVAGLLAGSAGLALEFWWMRVFMPHPLPPESGQLLLLAVGAAAGVGGGLLGVTFHRHLQRIAEPAALKTEDGTRAAVPGRWLGTIGVGVVVALMAGFAPPQGQGEVEVVKECDDSGCRTTYEPVADTGVVMAQVAYDEACGRPEEPCRPTVTVTLDPADAADDAVWISAIAYQGHEADDDVYPSGIKTTDMEPTGEPGQYRSADPLPVYGDWKVLVRLHRAPTTMLAIPLHMPEDAPIETDAAGLVHVADGDTVPFVHEPMLLQRERQDNVPAWLWSFAYALVIAAWLGLLGYYGWCYAAAARGEGRSAAPRREPSGR